MELSEFLNKMRSKVIGVEQVSAREENELSDITIKEKTATITSGVKNQWINHLSQRSKYK
jgi:hypothetical protein